MTSNQKQPIVICGAVRTPIGKFMGSFQDLSAADLGTYSVQALLGETGVDASRVDELIFGNGRQAGGGPNVARQISVRAGVPQERTAWTVNMACGSGLKTILLAADSIAAGRADLVVAGGTESMSGLPFFLPKMRKGYRLGHAPLVDGMYQDGFGCPLADMLMGETAEKLAREMNIGRDEQDAFALSSQHKSEAARAAGYFDAEICPVEVKQRRGVLLVEADEHARDGAKLESLGKLPPVFDREAGTVTAGNASGITDGACSIMVAAADRAEELGLEPLAYLEAGTEAGVDPSIMGIGPVPALERLQESTGRKTMDYDLVELNEAFAAQVLSCHQKHELPMDRLNVNGGAISLGHPIGATGARIVATLLHELKRRGGESALASLCISGGMGLAVSFHRKGL